jgi:hypothetical protein
VGDVAKQPGRIRWVLSDKKAFQTQVGRLKELTDYLQETLGDAVTEQPVLGSGSVHVATKPERRQTLFAQLTQFRYNAASLTAGPPENGELKSLKLQGQELGKLKLKPAGAAGDYRIPATYMGVAAWVEWKSYHSVRHLDQSGKPQYAPEPLAAANLESLVALLHMDNRPTQFRVPHCAGYFDDDENLRFGLIYRVPGATPQSAETTSLSNLLLRKGNPPPLESRISLAKELVTSLYFLHAVNWLHKGLRDECILVQMRHGSPDYSQPLISGFEYSRPDVVGLTTTAAKDTWAVYAHPDYLGVDEDGKKKVYRKTYDMYSLGIILLEIASWKPAEEILGFKESEEKKETDKAPGETSDVLQNQGESPGEEDESTAKDENPKKTYSKDSLSDLKNIRKRLLVDEPALLEHVRATMGCPCHDAVRACIGGLEHFKLPKDADETGEVIATLLQQAYLRLVVDVLRGIRV